MAVLKKDELMEKLRIIIGEQLSDEAVSFIEDITDTINDYEGREHVGEEEWKRRYNELDKGWRKRYRDRFFNGTDVDMVVKEQETDVKDGGEIKTFEELFEEREGDR